MEVKQPYPSVLADGATGHTGSVGASDAARHGALQNPSGNALLPDGTGSATGREVVPDPHSGRGSVLSLVAGVGTMVVAGLVLVGWIFDITVLTSGVHGLVSMKFNNALACALSGVALVVLYHVDRPHWAPAALAVLVATIGLLTLSEYLVGSDLGIDQLLISEPADAPWTSDPGRMAPTSALCLVFAGVALFWLSVRRHVRGAQMLASAVGLIGLLVVIEYLYGVYVIYSVAGYTRMAVPAVLCFLLLSLGLLSVRPGEGIVQVFSSDTLGGHMARRLLPASVVVPIVLGGLVEVGHRAGLYGLEFGWALFALSVILVLTIVVWGSAQTLHRMAVERAAADSFRKRFKFISDYASDAHFLVTADGTIHYVNRVACERLGYTADELLGMHVSEIDPQFEGAEDGRPCAAGETGSWPIFESVHRRKDGSTFPVEISLTKTVFDGTPHVYVVARDITERKRKEEALRESEERLRVALEAADMGTWRVDLATDLDTRDAALNRLLGLPPVESTQDVSDFIDRVHPEDRPMVLAASERAIAESGIYDVECRIVRPDGEVR